MMAGWQSRMLSITPKRRHLAFCFLLFAAFFIIQVRNLTGITRPVSSFALFSVFVGNGTFSFLPFRLRCQPIRQYEYAKRHGYDYFFFREANSEWQEEKSKYSLGLGWYKIYALRRLLALQEHEWVVYLDTDTTIHNFTMKMEEVVAQAPPDTSVIHRDSVGWNTHVIFLRNTEYSRNFVERVWSLRSRLNACPKYEQCAVVVALLEEVLSHEVSSWGNNYTQQTFRVGRDRGRPCCDPLTQHEKNDMSAQGCTWNWQRTLQVLEKNDHPHIYWTKERFGELNFGHHPDKKLCISAFMHPLTPAASRLPRAEPERYLDRPLNYRVIPNPNDTEQCTLEAVNPS